MQAHVTFGIVFSFKPGGSTVIDYKHAQGWSKIPEAGDYVSPLGILSFPGYYPGSLKTNQTSHHLGFGYSCDLIHQEDSFS